MGIDIGILHPGEMGAIVATSALDSGNRVWWASEGRSQATALRASNLEDAGTLTNLCGRCEIVISVCPPGSADRVADDVYASGFRGIFIDANAISPDRVRRMAGRLIGVDFVDGGIIGLPSLQRDQTWLHLSGPSARRVAECFSKGPMAVDVMGDEIGRASALKMCFAAYSKGSTALVLAVLGAAQELGVLDDLARQWDRKGPGVKNAERDILRAAPKAWRWVPEMYEIAGTLRQGGVPGEIHEAAADLYQRLSGFKDTQPSFEEVLSRLTTVRAQRAS